MGPHPDLFLAGHISWHLRVDTPIFEHQVTLLENYQFVAVLGELGSVGDSLPPHYQAAQHPLAVTDGEGQLQGSSILLLPEHPLLSEPKKWEREEIFVSD